MPESDKEMAYKSAREKFLGLNLESTRKSYYPELQKHLEVAKENEQRLQLLIDNLPARISYVDAEERYVFVNREYEKAFGLKRDHIVGKRMETILGQNNYIKVKHHIHEALSGKHVHFEISFTGQKNETRWLEINYVPETNPLGNVNGFYALTLDLTEKKRAEEEKAQLEAKLQQAQKMESIGTLAGGIAHDFNNILGIILGNAELAIDDVPEWNPARPNLEEIRTASLRARDFVRQLLSFARKTKLEKKPTNIIPIIKESLKLLRSSTPVSIEFRLNIPKDIYTIMADPTQINQVLINLCTNADHAMPDGGILEVSLKNIEFDEDLASQHHDLSPGRYVNLTVEDTGKGISQEEIDRIFDPYFTTKEVGKGTGMGLAVVHGIVKGHNGLITVESELGKGTMFNILFPAVEMEAVVGKDTAEELPKGNESILFIDDEESIMKIGQQRLERLGYKVEATTSPIEALDLFRSKPDQFDLVITDLTMPKMTGDKLIKEILVIRPDISIILCTGFSKNMDEKKARVIGAADYIEKPLDKHDFAFKVRKVLDENLFF